MPTTTYYTYIIRPRYCTLPDDQPPLFDDPFYVDLRFWYASRDQPEPISMIRKHATLPHGQLMKSRDTASLALRPFLSTAGVDVDDRTVTAVSAFARALSHLPICYSSRGLVVPGIELLILVDSEAVGLAMVAQWEEANSKVRTVPATDASIEALEEVAVDGDGFGSGSMEQCRICLEDYCGGSKVARMPCSHVYHGDCIVKWLRTSNLCPLCRYQMPTT